MPDSLSRTDKEFSEIYNRHVDTVYRVCFMFLKNPTDTEDAVQDTFIKLMNYSGSFESEEHEKAWLIKTASNHCRDILRHWWRRTIDLDDIGGSPEERQELEEPDETLEKVLALPAKYKTAIYLYYYEGYKTAEIAKMTNKPEATIRGYLHKGRQLLKVELGGEDIDRKGHKESD